MKNTNSTHLNRRPTMTKPKYTLRQAWDDGDIIVILIAIISIIITEFASCFTPSPKKLPQPLVTSPSPKKRVRNSSKQSATSKTHLREQSPALETSTETSEESCVVTGSLSMETSKPKVGTTSQATKRSKSGRSTASASRQMTKKSNQTIPTRGLGFSA